MIGSAMSGPLVFGMSPQRRSIHCHRGGRCASTGSHRARASPSRSGVPQSTSAATAAGRVAARWSARSAPIDSPTTATRATSRARRACSASTDAYQSVHAVRARSVTVVPCPASRTPRTGKPRAASASPSGRISQGVPVKPWTRRQPSGRVPGSAKPSTTGDLAALAAAGGVGPDLERAFAQRALLEKAEVRGGDRVPLLLEQAVAELVLLRGELRRVGRQALAERDDDRVAAGGVDLRRERRGGVERECVRARRRDVGELRREGAAALEGPGLLDLHPRLGRRAVEADLLRAAEESFAALARRLLGARPA